MNHYDYESLPNRGKPKPKVKYNDHHRLVLRALLALYKIGGQATDESIYEMIVKAKGTKAISTSGARTRRKELVEEFGLVRVSQVNGRTRSGKKCQSFRLTEGGLIKAREEFDAAKQTTIDTEMAAA